MIAMNRSTGVARAEYISGPASGTLSDGFEFQRVYADLVLDVADFLSCNGDFQSPANPFLLTLLGKPATAGSQVAVSIKAYVSAGLTNNAIYKACVNHDNGAMITDDSITCAGSVTGVAADDTGLAAVISDLNSNVFDLGTHPARLIAPAIISSTQTVNFTTAANLFTTNIAHSP